MLSKFIVPLLFITGAIAQHRLLPGYYLISNAARGGVVNVDRPGDQIFLDPFSGTNEIVS